MRKFIVIITLLYTAAAIAALGFLSNGFREGLALGESVIATTLVLGVIAALIVAVIAYWKDNEWLAVVLVAIILAAPRRPTPRARTCCTGGSCTTRAPSPITNF